jgi:hypothetical protein
VVVIVMVVAPVSVAIAVIVSVSMAGSVVIRVARTGPVRGDRRVVVGGAATASCGRCPAHRTGYNPPRTARRIACAGQQTE